MRSSRVRASLMTLSLISLVCFLVITSQQSALCQPGGKQSSAWPTPTAGTYAFVTVHVDSSRISREIPTDFAGFSLDVAFLCQLLELEKTDPTLYRLYDNLDPTLLRIGGASADRAAWTPEQDCSEAHIGRGMLDDLFAFARRLDAHVIWTVNLRAGDPRAAAQEAAYAIDTGGSTLSGIELGNEPNNYGIPYDRFRASWEAHYAAFSQLVSRPPIVGPDVDTAAWIAPFVRDEGSKLQLITAHYYPMSDMAAGGESSPSIANMLSKQLMARSRAVITQEMQVATTAHLPFALDETNNIVGNNRVKGVSEVFASALWGLDYLFTGVQLGVRSMAFFGDGGVVDRSLLSPIARAGARVYPRPLYYALLLFHLVAAGGRLVVTQASPTPVNITAYTVLAADGHLNVVLINKDLTKDAYVTVQTAQPFAAAQAMRLAAPSPASTYEAVTLGGSAITADGSWTPQRMEAVPSSGASPASWAIAVPHASAVALTLSAGSQPSKGDLLCGL